MTVLGWTDALQAAGSGVSAAVAVVLMVGGLLRGLRGPIRRSVLGVATEAQAPLREEIHAMRSELVDHRSRHDDDIKDVYRSLRDAHRRIDGIANGRRAGDQAGA